MATGYLQFTPLSALLPIASFAALGRHASSGTGLPEGWILSFDAAADEWCFFVFRVPDNYASGAVLKIQFTMVSATSGSVVWVAQVTCATDDADDMDVAAGDTENSATQAVANVAGEPKTASITLTNADSMAPGDLCIIRVSRDANHASDDAAGDAELWVAQFEYTTT